MSRAYERGQYGPPSRPYDSRSYESKRRRDDERERERVGSDPRSWPAATAAAAAHAPPSGRGAEPASHSHRHGATYERDAAYSDRDRGHTPMERRGAAAARARPSSPPMPPAKQPRVSSAGLPPVPHRRSYENASSLAPPPPPPPPALPPRVSSSHSHSLSPASAAGQAAAAAVSYLPSLNIPAKHAGGFIPQHWKQMDLEHSIQNDLSQYFVSTGNRPQNFLRDSQVSAEGDSAADAGTDPHAMDDRYGGDPTFAQFSRLKRQIVDEYSARQPYMAHRVDLRRLLDGPQLHSLLGGYEFDVIVVDPPWKEYEQRAVGIPEAERAESVWSLQELMRLPIQSLAAEPSLLFLWCGSGPHIAEATQLMHTWGFKQVEDICWLMTNKTCPTRKGYMPDDALFQRSHEHCLMGIRGEQWILRDRDVLSMPYEERMEAGLVQFVHAGVDIDVIVSESPLPGSTEKPHDLYHLIERYCVGRRRLELFGSEHNLRRGWLTLGSSIDSHLDNFDIDLFKSYFEVESLRVAGPGGVPPEEWATCVPPTPAAIGAQHARDDYDRRHGRFDARLSRYVPHSREVESVRPKSPPSKQFASKRRIRGTRRVWQAGVTAGIRALQRQMQAEGKRAPTFAPTTQQQQQQQQHPLPPHSSSPSQRPSHQSPSAPAASPASWSPAPTPLPIGRPSASPSFPRAAPPTRPTRSLSPQPQFF